MDRILTMENPRRRSVIVIDWCCICKASSESISHQLLHCLIARDVWNFIFSLFGIQWGGLGDEFKHHLVDWNTVCLPVAQGGLGVYKVADVNKALLGKWLWRFGMEDSQLWCRVIAGKYGLEGGWKTRKSNRPRGCGLWKGIFMGWENFAKHLVFDVDMGSRVRFWHNCWCGDLPLNEVFLVLFSCATNRNGTIDNCMVQMGARRTRVWDVSFTQNFNDWEIMFVAEFFQVINSHIPSREGMAVWRWKRTSTGIFDPHSFYRALSMTSQVEPFPWRGVWGVKVPRRVAFFVWTVVWGKILTMDNLGRPGMSWQDGVACVGQMGSQCIIYSCIVQWRLVCGILSSGLLG